MGLDSIPNICNSRIRGYDDANGQWLGVRVDQSGELAIHAEITDIVQARVSGQVVRLDGFYSTSGDWRYVEVDASGNILVEAVAEVSGATVVVSGQDIHISSGFIDIGSGNIDAHVESGEVHILSGLVDIGSGTIDAAVLSGEVHLVSGLVATESGEIHIMSGLVDIGSGTIDAAVLSGEVHLVSGLVATESGEIHLLSGRIDVLSGEVHILSGLVDIGSGTIDAAVLSGEVHLVSGLVGVQSGEIHLLSGRVDVLSGNVFLMSGMVNLIGDDYVNISGTIYPSSGEIGLLDRVTAVQVFRPIEALNTEGEVPETRLFTGSDPKHIRFEDIFDGGSLDNGKWNLTAGTVTISTGAAGGFADLHNAASVTTMATNNRYLYGVLSCKVRMDDTTDTDQLFGFIGDYTDSDKDTTIQWRGTAAGGRFHTEDKVATGGDTYTNVVLQNATWYHVQLVWTPQSAEIWVDGILRASHVTDIPQSPGTILFQAGNNAYMYVGNVSLTAYSEVPTAKQGRIPVREQGGGILAYQPIYPTQGSGGQVLGSGAVDRLIMKLPTISFSGNTMWSGQGIGTASGFLYGIWVGGTSGNRPWSGSGCVGSGKGLFIEPGEQKELYVNNLAEVYVCGEPSGLPLTFIGETMKNQVGW